MSIISQIFFPFSTGSNWSPAQKIVGSALGYLLQYLIVFAVISFFVILGAKISPSHRNRPLPPFINKALIATIVLFGFLIFGGWYANKGAVEDVPRIQTSGDYATSKNKEKVIAAITRQSSEGITSNDLNQDVLKNLESWVIQTILQKGKGAFGDLGFDPSQFNPKVNASSVYINVNDKKLAIIKISFEEAVRSVTIIGIEKNELLRVTCLRKSNHDIPVFSGECGDKVYEAFGVSITP